MKEFGLSHAIAYNALRYAVERGHLIKIGVRYYLPGTVVKPEDHYKVIRNLIEEDGAATMDAINRSLGTEYKAAWWIVTTLIKQGKIVRAGQKYMLPTTKSKDETSLKQ